MIKSSRKNPFITVLTLIGLLFITLSFVIFSPPKQASAATYEQTRYYTDYNTTAYTASSSLSVNTSTGLISGQVYFSTPSSVVEKFKLYGVIGGYGGYDLVGYSYRLYFFNESDKYKFQSAASNYEDTSLNSFKYQSASYSGTTLNFSDIRAYDYDYVAMVAKFESCHVHTSTVYKYYDIYKCVYSSMIPLKKDTTLKPKVDAAINGYAGDVYDSSATSRATRIKNLLPYSSYGYIESSKSGNVTVLYKGYDENGVIADKSFVFNVDDRNLLREKLYAKYLLLKTEFSKLSDFNLERKGLANAGEGYILNNKHTVLEALDISVDMSNFYSPVITIVYDQKTANDIAFTVMSNDENLSELKIDVYCGVIESNGQTGKVTFQYEDIETIAASTVHWIFEISSNYDDIQVITDSDTRVTVSDTELVVYYDLSKQNSLLNLNISYIGEVHEARLYDVELNYTEFEVDYDTVIETPRQETFIAYDLGIKNAVAVPSNIITGVGTSTTDLYYFPSFENDINGSIQSILRELNYCYYLDASLSAPSLYTTDKDAIAEKVEKGETVGKYVINIVYGYHPLFFVKSEGLKTNYDFFLVSPFATTITVNGTYFVEDSDIPEGYRVSSINIPKSYLVTSKQDAENYANSTFTFNQGFNDKAIIPVTVKYSDTYIIKFDYFARYNNTPFALLTSFNGTAKVSDFADITKPTAKELAQVVANNGVEKVVEELSFLGLVKPDESLITYKCISPGVYEYEVPYTYASVKAQESDGSFSETKVPMTKYSDWTAQWGEDWGVTMLNHSGAMYFSSNDTHLKENLYGLFACIQFKERVTNIYDWFNDVTNGGCVVEYQRKEVKGSQVYTFITENKILLTAATAVGGFVIGGATGAAIGALIPSVIQAGCEIVNDENATYYSHFFYLDGTSKLPYVSNSGADGYDDNDTSIENEIEDTKDKLDEITDKVEEKLQGFWEKVGNFFKKIGVYLLAGIACLSGIGALISIILLIARLWKKQDVHVVFKIILTVLISASTIALFYIVGYKMLFNWIMSLGVF